MFVWNLLLALGWAAFSGDFTLVNVLIGFVVGYGILYLAQPITGRSRYTTKVPELIGFIVYYVWLFILANLRIAYDIIRPNFQLKPGVIAIPLEARSDLEIVVLANLITLTPGTLSLDVSTDRRFLYIHALYIDDIEKVRREIKQGLEQRLLQVMR
jgi:multicomponent Na+:H+ antiporter subunit E